MCAALAKSAARRQGCQGRRGTGDLHQVAPRRGTRRQAVDQALRVGVARSAQHFGSRAFFNQTPGIHHQQAGGEHRYRGQVVADPHQADASFSHQSFHLDKDLRLNRHIKRRSGFVADHQRRVVEKGNRNGHPLAHAARQFVRIGVQPSLRVGYADLAQCIERTGARLSGVRFAVGTHCQLHLRKNGEYRV